MRIWLDYHLIVASVVLRLSVHVFVSPPLGNGIRGAGIAAYSFLTNMIISDIHLPHPYTQLVPTQNKNPT